MPDDNPNREPVTPQPECLCGEEPYTNGRECPACAEFILKSKTTSDSAKLMTVVGMLAGLAGGIPPLFPARGNNVRSSKQRGRYKGRPVNDD